LLVIEAKGDGAMEYAPRSARVLLQKGDETGTEAWLRVLTVIAELKAITGSNKPSTTATEPRPAWVG
jgi:hypothetical protein